MVSCLGQISDILVHSKQLGFTSMYAHRKGEREDMQDRHLIVILVAKSNFNKIFHFKVNNFQLPIKDMSELMHLRQFLKRVWL